MLALKRFNFTSLILFENEKYIPDRINFEKNVYKGNCLKNNNIYQIE